MENKLNIIEAIENPRAGPSNSRTLKYNSMALEIPQNQGLEDVISKAGGIIKDRFFGGSGYGYITTFKEAVNTDNLGAVLITHEVHGYNYYDSGHVSRSFDHIFKMIKEENRLEISPLLNRLCENGYIDDSEYYRMYLDSIDEDGNLKLNVAYRTNFVPETAYANAGVCLSGPPKKVRRGKGFRDVEETYSLVKKLNNGWPN